MGRGKFLWLKRRKIGICEILDGRVFNRPIKKAFDFSNTAIGICGSNKDSYFLISIFHLRRREVFLTWSEKKVNLKGWLST